MHNKPDRKLLKKNRPRVLFSCFGGKHIEQYPVVPGGPVYRKRSPDTNNTLTACLIQKNGLTMQKYILPGGCDDCGIFLHQFNQKLLPILFCASRR
jgi:hypothetical protein